MIRAFFLLSAVTITSCTFQAVNNEDALSDLEKLKFIQDSVTTKKEILLKLGPPSGKYQDDSILTYRLSYDVSSNEKWHVVDKCLPFNWQFVDYNLVLVFDNNNIVEKQSLIPIRSN